LGVVSLSDSSVSGPGVSGDIEFDTGYGLGAVGGFDYGTWRLEGELTYRANDIDQFSGFGLLPVDGDVSSMALMANAYYDFRMVSPAFVPYIGGGLGGARIAVDASGVDDDDIVFAYQFAAGIGFAVNKQVTLDLGYRYFATADQSFEVPGIGTVDGEYKSHNVFLGARFNF
jgi:opacity protein-like surface antigen